MLAEEPPEQWPPGRTTHRLQPQQRQAAGGGQRRWPGERRAGASRLELWALGSVWARGLGWRAGPASRSRLWKACKTGHRHFYHRLLTTGLFLEGKVGYHVGRSEGSRGYNREWVRRQLYWPQYEVGESFFPLPMCQKDISE